MTEAGEWGQEGKARFVQAGAFFRPHSQVGRDLAILAAVVYRQQRGQLRVLDVMTGCGVRSLRYHLEAEADWIWANEGNPELREVLNYNLSQGMRPRSYRITYQDANQVFFTCYRERDFYDLVDIDCFGSGAPYLSTGLWAARIGGLVYLTSTDTRTTSGHNPAHSVAMYGAIARSHPAAHEQGVRLLLGSALQQAATRGMQVEPIFSLFNGQVHRVMVRLTMGQQLTLDRYGFLAYCHYCGHFQTLDWMQLGQAVCLHHETPRPMVVSGPLWLGPLHDGEMLGAMAAVAAAWGWEKRVKLLHLMQQEATMPPYYFRLGDLGRWLKGDIPPRDRLVMALQAQGYRACLTHFDAQAIKTTATWAECLAIARSLGISSTGEG